MTDSNSEDVPLLDSIEPPSPPVDANVHPWHADTDNQEGPNAPIPTSPVEPERPWVQGHEWLETEVRSVPKTLPSQSSMDSGCDCETSEGDPHYTHGTERASRTPAGGSDPTEAGPSGCCDVNRKSRTADSNFDCDKKSETNASQESLQITQTSCDRLPSGLTRVTFRIEGYEEEDENRQTCDSANNAIGNPAPTGVGGDFKELVRAATKSFPRIPSFSRTGVLSASSSTASMPMCRICHLPHGEGQDILISPCRCAGTMQFIHEKCLTKWLEICSKRSKKSPVCELCQYQFHRHKKFKLRHWKLPTCSFLDKLLHSLFLLCIILMVVSAGITIYCFKQDRFQKKRENTDLTRSEIVTLTCGVLFFVAFFVAMYVEVKAKDTLYRLFSRFLHLNQTWHIDEYDKRKDEELYQVHV